MAKYQSSKHIFLPLSLIFAVVATEVLLQIIGGLSFFLTSNNQNVPLNTGQVKILCVGESTTFFGGENSYPAILEKKLNNALFFKEKGLSFTVINKGYPSIGSYEVVENALSESKKLQPDWIISMMGINDHLYTFTDSSEDIFSRIMRNALKLKTARLFYFIWRSIFPWKNVSTNNPLYHSNQDHLDQNYIDEINKLISNKCCDEKATKLEEMIKFDSTESIENYLYSLNLSAEITTPSIVRLFLILHQNLKVEESSRLAEFHSLLLEKIVKSDFIHGYFYQLYADALSSKVNHTHGRIIIDYYKKAEQSLGYLPPSSLIEIARIYSLSNQYDQASHYFKKALTMNPKDEHFWSFAIQSDIDYNRLSHALEKTRKASLELPHHQKFSKLENILTRILNGEDIPAHIDENFRPNPRIMDNSKTRQHYISLAHFAKEQKIKLAFMQYPLRDIHEIIEQIPPDFINSKEIIFIENKRNFIRALSNKQFDEIFWDRFAGDFGHSTDKGNELIAENILSALINYYRKI